MSLALFCCALPFLPAAAAEGAGLASWQGWPPGKLQVAAGAEDSLVFDQLNNTGFFPLQGKKAGSVLREVRFSIRKLQESRVGKLEVMVQEKGGEIFYREIELAPEWRNHSFRLDSLRLYPYGGAKIEDGRLDPAAVERLRFNGWPAGRKFEIAGLELIYAEENSDGTLRESVDSGSVEWHCWPAGKVGVKSLGRGRALLDLMKPGHVSLPLPAGEFA